MKRANPKSNKAMPQQKPKEIDWDEIENLEEQAGTELAAPKAEVERQKQASKKDDA